MNSDVYINNKLRFLRQKAVIARQYFDAHPMQANEVQERSHLEELEFLLDEIRRLTSQRKEP